MEHESLKYLKYAWKPMYKNCWKQTIKAQEQREWRSSGVFIVNFRCVCIQDLAEHLRWSFFLQLNRQIQFSWVTRGFSTSFRRKFIQVFWKLILKKNSNIWDQQVFKTNRAYSRNLGQHSILARKNTFYEKRAFFMKKMLLFRKKSPLSSYSISFLKVLHQSKALHDSQKRPALNSQMQCRSRISPD